MNKHTRGFRGCLLALQLQLHHCQTQRAYPHPSHLSASPPLCTHALPLTHTCLSVVAAPMCVGCSLLLLVPVLQAGGLPCHPAQLQPCECHWL